MTIVGLVAGHEGRSLVLLRAYVDAVLAAGGTPVVLPAAFGPGDDRLDRALAPVEALLLTGGGDIAPARYGAPTTTTLDHVDPVRDDVELRALRWAERSGIRALGICRGAQLMAVAHGGSLIQDLPAAGFDAHVDVRHDRGYATLRHGVKAEPDSLTEAVLGGLDEVNTHHHQAVHSPGQGLTATAWSTDGVIEAIEGPGLLGVQWHPETLFAADPRHLRPFQWLVDGEQGLRT
ncbi:gamma-glutamyl-gamma-aminobutyrate hydrolase family protein [Geodermatophilus ruber]|uniref:Putative glutamine amidotransferase n=1 Tax=Geodermatophilus ruber TaxID=504800 RepID=A0A1I4GM53_9ACTN|nr:type 1 glutamine amidotransferase [Geodermatophilus ruber]SFL30580.1 putative glutamine amidotransferase [Geodermatophilus ruber]